MKPLGYVPNFTIVHTQVCLCSQLKSLRFKEFLKMKNVLIIANLYLKWS